MCQGCLCSFQRRCTQQERNPLYWRFCNLIYEGEATPYLCRNVTQSYFPSTYTALRDIPYDTTAEAGLSHGPCPSTRAPSASRNEGGLQIPSSQGGYRHGPLHLREAPQTYCSDSRRQLFVPNWPSRMGRMTALSGMLNRACFYSRSRFSYEHDLLSQYAPTLLRKPRRETPRWNPPRSSHYVPSACTQRFLRMADIPIPLDVEMVRYFQLMRLEVCLHISKSSIIRSVSDENRRKVNAGKS